jgi:hypothetical protein
MFSRVRTPIRRLAGFSRNLSQAGNENGRSTANRKFFWRKASGMEAFRISFYLLVPLLASYIYADPAVMNKLIMAFKFIQYPQSDPSQNKEVE